MAKKRVVLTFPPELTEKPLTYHLVKDFDLAINILRAKITPGEEGKLVLELSNGSEEMIEKGLDFLVKQGGVEAVSREIPVKRIASTRRLHGGLPTVRYGLTRKPPVSALIKNAASSASFAFPLASLGIIKGLFSRTGAVSMNMDQKRDDIYRLTGGAGPILLLPGGSGRNRSRLGLPGGRAEVENRPAAPPQPGLSPGTRRFFPPLNHGPAIRGPEVVQRMIAAARKRCRADGRCCQRHRRDAGP